ncbi:hypothetical protein [Cryobacterium melibiosiphilum]|nr:hypothetical protein [Cryobacterium melibiosiphilum]
MTNSFTMTRVDAKRLAQIALSAASKDDVTPVICGALLTVSNGALRTTSTDRYRVHTALIDIEGKSEDHEFIISRSSLEWLDKNVGTFGSFQAHRQRVTITTNLDALNITVRASDLPEAESVSWSGRTTKGNFPPVIRLIEKARESEPISAEASFRLEYLAKAKVLSHLGDAPLIRFTVSENPNKPGPVYFAFSSAGKVYAEAIIQPNLNLS